MDFKFDDVEYIPGKVDESNVDDLRRYLEDTMSLVSLVDEPRVDYEATERLRNNSNDDDSNDDDSDDED